MGESTSTAERNIGVDGRLEFWEYIRRYEGARGQNFFIDFTQRGYATRFHYHHRLRYLVCDPWRDVCHVLDVSRRSFKYYRVKG